MGIEQAIKAIEIFKGDSLTDKLAVFECALEKDKQKSDMKTFCCEQNINEELFKSVQAIKKVSSQIDVIMHAVGMLYAIPNILEEGEKIEEMSLGAGSGKKKFDLKTNFRIAEFKFIDWKGNDSDRQDGIFKDFHGLAKADTDKIKILYVVDKDRPLEFFKKSKRNIEKISKEIHKEIKEECGDQMEFVRDYYAWHEDNVHIEDIRRFMPKIFNIPD